jgi:thioredoxin reductase (NADPH)
MSNQRDLIIIGSGPAGLTSAIYAARAQLAPLIIEGEPSSTSDQPGGQLMLTTEVENYPGFVEGIMGPELMDIFRQQAQRFGAEFQPGKVSSILNSSSPFELEISGSSSILRAKSLIIATGAKPLMLGIDREAELLGHGVSTCATCDGFFFRDMEIAVVGGGDSALEEALFLTRFAKKVHLVHRRNELRASKIMQKRALENEKIIPHWNSVVSKIYGDASLTGVELSDTESHNTTHLSIQGLFVAIGHIPNTDIFRDKIEMDETGYIVTRNGTQTNIPGIFAAGDVQDRVYRQAITSAGSGCMAAIDAERWIAERE